MNLPRTLCRPLLIAAALLTAAAGCSDDDNTLTAPPEEPMPPRITETFRGEFGKDENSEHPFTVSETGAVDLQITSLQPLATLTVGMGLGRFDPAGDPTCSLIASDNRVVVGSILTSRRVAPGEYCVSVGDVGNVFPDAVVSYVVAVTHP